MTTTHRRAENVEAIAAVTPMQQGMLFHSLKVRAEDPYFIQRVFIVNSPIDIGALRRAWQVAVDRHQVLRADYRWEEAAKPAQVIYKSVPVEIRTASWRGLPPREQLERLRGVLAQQRAEGYDFRRASELRVLAIELEDEAHWLVWSYHHIALDGWSAALILSDVLSAYHAGSSGLAPAQPYTAYLDFVHKQEPARALEHFRAELEGAEIPTPLPRVETGERGYAEHVLRVSRADTERLRERSRKLGITLNTLVHGAWALLLGRHADRSEVVFGATVSGRSADLPGIDGMAGLFINTLPSRIRLPASRRVRDWLADIQAQSLESRRYEHTPLGEIRRAAGVAGDQTLFDSVVVFENYPIDEVLERQPSGLRVQPMAAEVLFESGVRTTGRNNYPLTLNVIPGEELVLTVAYQRDHFDERAVARLSVQLEHLLGALSERVEARLGEFGLLTAAEAPAPAAQAAGPFVLEAFQRRAQRAPDATALQMEERACTYGELDAASNRVARALLERGIRTEARVGLQVERSIELVTGVLGCWKAGAAYVPLDPKLPAARLDALARESALACVLDGEAIARLASAPGSSEPAPVALHPEQAAYVIFTSGSTGTPKGVVVSHCALAGYVNGMLEQLAVPAGASMAMVSTVAADLGHTVLFGALASGGRLHLLDEVRAFDPDAFAEYLARHAIEVLKIVPSHLSALLHAAEPARALPSKLLILGGEASTWSLAERVRALRPECRVVNHYGPTEATVGASFHALEAAAPVVGRSVPIGRALPGAVLEVLDRELNRVPDGVTGELYIGGGRLARGYFAAPGASAARFVPDPYGAPGARLYRTGDRVKRHAGGVLEFLGRADRQIKLRGYRVELGEIEHRLRAHGAVRAAVVVPRETGAGVLRLCAYVAADGVSGEALQAYLGAELPDYMVPAQVVVLGELPLTRNGKLDWASLPAAAQAPVVQENDDAAADSDVERALIEVWRDVLRVERVGANDDFFKLGGDSILSLQVVARARRRGLKVTPQQLFEHRTLRALASVAAVLPPKGAAVPAAKETRAASGQVPLVPIQARFFAREIPERQRYNQSVLLRARERIDPAALERAWAGVVEYHEAFGLRFRRDEKGAWGQVHAQAGDRQLWLRKGDQAADCLEEVHSSLSLEEGPLLRAALIELPNSEQRLSIAIHHLVVDGVSWRVLLEDLQTLYRGGSLPPKTSSFAHWAEKLAAYARKEAVAQELPYWLEQLRQGAELAADRSGPNLVKHGATYGFRMSREQTSALLRQVPEHYECRTQELLVTALARVLCRRGESEGVAIELESHGREALFDGVDLSRTVGWFTSMYPVWLAPGLGGRESFRAAVRAVREQLRRVPRGGVGFGALRYVVDAPQLRELPVPRVTFNYLGQFDSSFDAGAPFEPASEQDARGQSEEAPLGNWLTITSRVYDGELGFDFAFSREVYERETIEGLARMYRAELESMIAGLGGGER